MKRQRLTYDLQRFLAEKVPLLIQEGYPRKQALAIAFSMARKAGMSVPPPPAKNPPDEDLRSLLRRASTGDLDAARRFRALLKRLLPDLIREQQTGPLFQETVRAREAASQAGHHEAAGQLARANLDVIFAVEDAKRKPCPKCGKMMMHRSDRDECVNQDCPNSPWYPQHRRWLLENPMQSNPLDFDLRHLERRAQAATYQSDPLPVRMYLKAVLRTLQEATSGFPCPFCFASDKVTIYPFDRYGHCRACDSGFAIQGQDGRRGRRANPQQGDENIRALEREWKHAPPGTGGELSRKIVREWLRRGLVGPGTLVQHTEGGPIYRVGRAWEEKEPDGRTPSGYFGFDGVNIDNDLLYSGGLGLNGFRPYTGRRSNPQDDEIRRLERAASTGDERARQQLEQMRHRLEPGASNLPPEKENVAREIVEAVTDDGLDNYRPVKTWMPASVWSKQRDLIIQNLRIKVAKGVYDRMLAAKLWRYLVEAFVGGAQGMPGLRFFTPAQRLEIARRIAVHFEPELRAAPQRHPDGPCGDPENYDFRYDKCRYAGQVCVKRGWSKADKKRRNPDEGRCIPSPESGGQVGFPRQSLPKHEWAPPRVSFDLMTSGRAPLVYMPEGTYEFPPLTQALGRVLTRRGMADPQAWEDLLASCQNRARVFLSDRRGERWELRGIDPDYGGQTGVLVVRHLGPLSRRGDVLIDLHKAFGHFVPVVVYKPTRRNPRGR